MDRRTAEVVYKARQPQSHLSLDEFEDMNRTLEGQGEGAFKVTLVSV